MRNRPLGPSGIEASVVGLGTWVMGGWMWGGADDVVAVKAIEASLDAGITLVDTAPIYGFGRAEEIVGRAIRGRRQQVVLATKCGLIWHREQGEFFLASDPEKVNEAGPLRIHRCLSPGMVRYDLEQSLKRLGVDYIDLYQTHWQDSTTPIEDTVQTLMDLKKEGKIRAIGCSNATPAQMERYRSAGILDADQEKFSILDRTHEKENLPYCADHGMAFLAYSPLAFGLLTGKISPGREFPLDDLRHGNPRFMADNLKKVKRMLDAFRPVAERHHASLAQLAIAWTLSQRGCTHALVGARNVSQAMENVPAGEISLTAEDLQLMREAITTYGADIP